VLMEISVVEQRYQAVLAVLGGVPVTEVASRFGVGRRIEATVANRDGITSSETNGEANLYLVRKEGLAQASLKRNQSPC
jgi:transposase